MTYFFGIKLLLASVAIKAKDCGVGWAEDGGNCYDINECYDPELDGPQLDGPKLDKSPICPKNSNCANTPGSYTCSCWAGYYWLNDECVDIDECVDMNDPNQISTYECPEKSDCANTVGSFMCICQNGYFSMNDECFDVNECLIDALNQCSDKSDCINTDGSYTCTCKRGYQGEPGRYGDGCTNRDECEAQRLRPLLPIWCEYASGAVCTDTIGSWECKCPAHYHGTGYSGDPCVKEVVRA